MEVTYKEKEELTYYEVSYKEVVFCFYVIDTFDYYLVIDANCDAEKTLTYRIEKRKREINLPSDLKEKALSELEKYLKKETECKHELN
jgi:hypothetical protein